MRLSSTQLEQLRQRPQQTTLYLSIFQPQVVMKCRLNNSSAAKGDRIIPYDGVTVGSFSNVEANYMMWIGSSDGARDLGKARVRSATSSQFVVGENSNVAWQDNAWLTVYKFVELNPIYPRITENPSNISDSIFHKDYDTVYSNQNSVLGTFPCAGPHWGLFKGEKAYYSSTGTLNLLGSALSFNWTFEGGSPSSSASAHPGLVTYNTPGHYTTKLAISGSNGTVDTTYRYVSVYDKEGEGSSPPINKWEMTSLGGSRDEGGYKANFKVFEDVPIEENAVVVIFSDDWHGNTRVSLGGNYPNAEKIFWVGYVMEGSIQYNYKYSYVEFSAASISELMKNSLGFSVSVESKANPAKWYELLDLDCRRAIYHYLRWHTTALQIADFQFVGDDRKIQFFDADRASMWDAIDNLMRNTLIGKCVSDRQGKVWMEVDAKAYTTPTSSFPSVMDIAKRDWMGQPSVEERLSDQLSYLEYGGIAYSGVNTGTFSAILASAPGNAPSFRGTTEVHEGLALLGQAQLSQLVGNVWANENADYPGVNMDMGIATRNLDIAPQETTQITIAESDTVRGIEISDLYIPNGMDWRYDPSKKLLLPSVDFGVLVNGIAGETITIPDPEDVGDGFDVPGLEIPPIPPFNFPAFGSSTGSSCCDELAALTNSQCCTVIKGVFSVTTPTGAGESILNITNYEYYTNPNMYDPNYTDGSNILGIGASGTYSVNVEFDYVDQSSSALHDQGCRLIVCYNTATGFAFSITYDPVEGTSGHVVLSGTASLPGDPGATGFMARVSRSFIDSPHTTYRNLKLIICKIA